MRVLIIVLIKLAILGVYPGLPHFQAHPNTFKYIQIHFNRDDQPSFHPRWKSGPSPTLEETRNQFLRLSPTLEGAEVDESAAAVSSVGW